MWNAQMQRNIQFLECLPHGWGATAIAAISPWHKISKVGIHMISWILQKTVTTLGKCPHQSCITRKQNQQKQQSKSKNKSPRDFYNTIFPGGISFRKSQANFCGFWGRCGRRGWSTHIHSNLTKVQPSPPWITRQSNAPTEKGLGEA